MKTVMRAVGNVLAVPLAALAGNWVGGRLRAYLTGEEVQTLQFEYETKKGRTLRNTPVATKFYPGLLVAGLGKPRWAFAFLGGLLAGGLVPDHLERYWLERVIEPLFVDRIPGEGEPASDN